MIERHGNYAQHHRQPRPKSRPCALLFASADFRIAAKRFTLKVVPPPPHAPNASPGNGRRGCASAGPWPRLPSPARAQLLRRRTTALLDEVEKACFLYFWEQAHPDTGLVKDRSKANTSDSGIVASIAATGFGLTALCIGEKRGWVSYSDARDRVVATLNFLARKMPTHRGFFFHWANITSGERIWDAEVSSVDTAILLCGVLTARQHFRYAEITRLASEIFARVDWTWLSEDTILLPHGWTPEFGFLPYRWDYYSELMMIYLLGLGSEAHPLPPDAWNAWKRTTFEYDGLRYIGSYAPLFVHQYSQAWFDFRSKRDRYADYFKNSTHRHRSSSPILPGIEQAVSRLQRRFVGHHGIGFAERLRGVGRAAGDRPD